MKTSFSMLVVAFLLAGPAVAEKAAAPDKKVTLANVTCADLKPTVRGTHPECLPQQSKAKALKPVLVSDNRGTGGRKKLTKMPWMIGVFQ